MNRLFKYAMFFTAFIPLWITILFLDIMSITDETNNYIGKDMYLRQKKQMVVGKYH